MRLLLGILVFLVLSAVALMVGYLLIDQRVRTRLQRDITPTTSAIYSDNLVVESGTSFMLKHLREQLLTRRYREVEGEPHDPGEFSYSGEGMVVLTREFSGPTGELFKPQRVVLDESTHSVSPNLYVEPQIIAVLGDGDIRAQQSTPLEEFPKDLQVAVIAIEDERFSRHHGIDLVGVARALVTNVKALAIVQGGSTITQQLAKNLFFSPTRSIGRKVVEALAAISLERRLSKREILELYLNEVYLGQEGAVAIHGFQEAAQTFFGKKVQDLSLAESATLAGIIRAPSFYSPRKHPDRAVERRDTVLDKMGELGYPYPAELTQARVAKLQVIKQSLHQRRAPHFVAAMQQLLNDQLNLDAALQEGVSVYTGIDINLQECAEHALQNGLQAIEKRYPKLVRSDSPLEGGLLAIEPFSGKVRAWVGGRDYSVNQFDHVLQAKRQVGSTIKPFLYLTALDHNLNQYKVATTTSVLSDRPVTLELPTRKEWIPENFDKEFRGDVTLRYALENSLNLPAVYVSQRVGIEAFAKTVKAFHLSGDVPAVPALALGAVDTTLLDLTAAYAALANGGIYVAPRPFVTARDNQGVALAESKISEQKLADENAVFVLTNILQGVVERGTGANVRRSGYQGPVAGKTGTSNDARDAWFEGFTPDLASGVWVGYDDNKKIGLTGGAVAAPIWAEFMKCAGRFHEPAPFLTPGGVTFVDIDATTGLRSTPECPPEAVAREVYVVGTEPLESCRLHSSVPVEETPRLEEFEAAEPKRKRRRGFWENLFG